MDRTSRLVLTLVACLSMLTVTHADTPTPKSLYDSGMKHYNLAEFEAALTDFKEAYRLKPDPVFLFNIAQCHRRLDDPASAATFYRSYLRESRSAPNRTEVEKFITEMDAAADAKAKARAETDARDAAARDAAQKQSPEAKPPDANAIVAAPPPAKKPLYKKGWFWGAIVGGAAVVGLGVGLGVGFGVHKNPSVALGTAVVK